MFRCNRRILLVSLAVLVALCLAMAGFFACHLHHRHHHQHFPTCKVSWVPNPDPPAVVAPVPPAAPVVRPVVHRPAHPRVVHRKVHRVAHRVHRHHHCH